MIKASARAYQLATLLDDMPEGIEWLSLDCFDTLLWRDVHAPTDVFTELPLTGGGIEPRIWAERQARLRASVVHERGDVTLSEIYDYLMPSSDDETRLQAAAAELDHEARHCFGFAPVRDLMIAARRRGLKIMIVSDIYMREAELRSLIDAAIGPDILQMVDGVFVSCEYGTGKTERLFQHVLAEIGVSPSRILHLGDNKEADQESPSRLGIHTVHFEQFAPDVVQRLRLEAVAATLVGRSTRVTTPVYQPHRPQLALRTEADPAYALGHDVLGPVMHGFADWLRTEAQDMETRTGKPVKLLFLMRDGYLPMKAFNILYPDLAERAIAAEISRFTATGSSFTGKQAIIDYLAPDVTVKSAKELGKQMLLTPEETAKLATADPCQFIKTVCARYADRIVQRSSKFADRIIRHLKSLDVAEGDAVMLVDVGYNGTVQNVLEPVLRDRMGLDVSGRYLALRQVQATGLDKRGYIDARNFDMKLVTACYESIAVVEEFINLAQGSVLDYAPDGSPIRMSSPQKEAQSRHRDVAQRGCLDYVSGARDGLGVIRRSLSDTADTRRELAASCLVRFLFLPMAEEVEVVNSFHHEVNQGSQAAVQLIDLENATRSLRRRGMFYSRDMDRVFLPGEMQRHGLPINLSILCARRFGLDLRKTDFDVGGMKIPVLLMEGAGHCALEIEALPTADGYYQATIPVGAGKFTVGIQFGQIFDWVQLDDLTFFQVDDLDFSNARGMAGVAAVPVHDAMVEMAPGLFQCDPAAFTLIPPPAKHSAAVALIIVFRPVLRRDETAAHLNANRKAA